MFFFLNFTREKFQRLTISQREDLVLPVGPFENFILRQSTNGAGAATKFYFKTKDPDFVNTRIRDMHYNKMQVYMILGGINNSSQSNI